MRVSAPLGAVLRGLPAFRRAPAAVIPAKAGIQSRPTNLAIGNQTRIASGKSLLP